MNEHLESVKLVWEIGLTVATIALVLVTGLLALFTYKVANETRNLARDAHESALTQIGVQTWMQFTERFDSPAMVEARGKLAKNARAKRANVQSLWSIQDTVPEFFETLGLAYNRGYIQKELARDSFGYYVWRWHAILRPYIAQERASHQHDSTLYIEFEEFAKSVGAKEQRLSGQQLEATLVAFLLEEISRKPTNWDQ